MLGIGFDHGTLAEEAFAWERGIDEIAEGDEEMTGYIEQLEKARDELQESEGSGDLLASEFEKFLRQSYEKRDEEKSEGKEDSAEG
jgi:hypothetical protein